MSSSKSFASQLRSIASNWLNPARAAVPGDIVVDDPALVSDSSEIGDRGRPVRDGLVRAGRSGSDGDDEGGVAGGVLPLRRIGP